MSSADPASISSRPAGPSSPNHNRNRQSVDLENGLRLDDLRSPHQNLQSGDNASSMHSGSSASWDSSHPCYPHANPHVALSSPLAQSTRIIRIPRDYMLAGDLAPAFSHTYPKILEPCLDEDRYRHIIKSINADLKAAFNPWSWQNWLDMGVGVVSLWFAEDIFGTEIKRRLKKIETFLEDENAELEEAERKRKEMGERGSEEEEMVKGVAKIISLRRTGYMNLDIQIPNPFPNIDYSDMGDGEYTCEQQQGSMTPMAGDQLAASAPQSAISKDVQHRIQISA